MSRREKCKKSIKNGKIGNNLKGNRERDMVMDDAEKTRVAVEMY